MRIGGASAWLLALVAVFGLVPADKDGQQFEALGGIKGFDSAAGVPFIPGGRYSLPEDGGPFLQIGRMKPTHFELGARVWLRGTLDGRDLLVEEYEILPAMTGTGNRSEGWLGPVKVALADVSAHCDHMPVMAPGERRQFLMVTLILVNQSPRTLEVSLTRSQVFINDIASKDDQSNLTLREVDGRPAEGKKILVGAGATRRVILYGRNLYPEGSEWKRLSVAVELSADGQSLSLTGKTRVHRTD